MQASSPAWSLIPTAHSLQTPIPQKTPRLSPASVIRQVYISEFINADATVSPCKPVIGCSLNVKLTFFELGLIALFFIRTNKPLTKITTI